MQDLAGVSRAVLADVNSHNQLTVAASDQSYRSKVLDTGDRFSMTFAKPGTYEYFCSIHPHMTGKVVVKAP